MKVRFTLFCLLLFSLPLLVTAQRFKLEPGEKYQKVRFELINNLMIIPMEVNGAKLSFILDSGVSKPILFNLADQDSIELKNVTEITINGLGEGDPIRALESKGNSFRLKDLFNDEQDLYVVLDREINLSTSLGVPVHGIIGYDLFRSFVVDINYSKQTIKFHDPKVFKPKPDDKSQTLPLMVRRTKAYVDGFVAIQDKEEIPVKLLIDTGSSDAIWLFDDPELGLEVPEKNYEDFLGRGLNGKIYGKRTRVSNIRLGNFMLDNAKAAFPYMDSFSTIKPLGDRNGSIGAEVLRRFNIVFNYPARRVTLKKNKNFNSPFQFNMSGIALQHNGMRYIAERITDAQGVVRKDDRAFGDVQILFGNRTRLSLVPEIIVSGIRAGSPAEEAGLREGDVVLAVNGKRIHRYKLQEVLRMLNEKEGKRVRILIERYNKDLLFSFVLEDMFK